MSSTRNVRYLTKIEQLLRVALEIRDQEKLLDMCFWGSSTRPTLDCGYSGCLIGWSGMDPWFKKHHLTMIISKDGSWVPRYIHANNKRVYGWDAVHAFFGICGCNDHLGQSLFEGNAAYSTIDQVIERLEGYVAYLQEEFPRV